MHHHHHHCHEDSGTDKGPAMFYGYCHETRQMRMMDYADYMKNVQAAMTNLYSGANPMAQMMAQQVAGMMQGTTMPSGQRGSGYHEHRGCGCHEHGHEHHDCGCHEHRHHDCGCEHECECRIRCADAVEYARCGEVRQIPITFENDTRRERNVTLTMGSFTTESGQQLGWQASLSESTFTLPACGRKTVLLTVPVECAGVTKNPPPGTTDAPPTATGGQGGARQSSGVDSCRVAYATLQAEGCRVRPMVIAVAVLPDHCHAHQAECGCC